MVEPIIANVGVERFNNDHQRLLFYIMEFSRITKRFLDRDPYADEWDQVLSIFPRLEKYTEEHFQAEEQLMRQYAYPYLDEHIEQHNQLIGKVRLIRKEIDARRSLSIANMEALLVDWIQSHINHDDLKYCGFFQYAETREITEKAIFNEIITVDQFRLMVERTPPDVVFLDIRTDIEHRQGVISGSCLYPCDHDLDNRFNTEPFQKSFNYVFNSKQFDSEKLYVLICHSGVRTEFAMEVFLEHGLKACELLGGIEEWKRQNNPISLFGMDMTSQCFQFKQRKSAVA
jgi:hemerythrin